MSAKFDSAPVVEMLRTRARLDGSSTADYVLRHHGDSMYRQLMRWQGGSQIRDAGKADDLAIQLGVHPIELWGDAWLNVEHPDDSCGTLLAYEDGCTCLPCLRAGLDALRERMWAMSPLSRDELQAVHDGTEAAPVALSLVTTAENEREAA